MQVSIQQWARRRASKPRFASREGKVVVERDMVSSTGKAFKRKYWVNPKDVKPGDKVVKDRPPASEVKVKKMQESWVEDQHSPGALALRAGAAVYLREVTGKSVNLSKEASAIVASKVHTEQQETGRVISSGERKLLEEKVLAALITDGRKANAEVRAMATEAQSFYPEDAPVTLYRGVTGEQARRVKAGEPLDVGCVSSWTDNLSVAKGFAEVGEFGVTRGGKAKPGVVVAVQVPRSSILASHRVPDSPLALNPYDEQEVLVGASSPLAASIVR